MKTVIPWIGNKRRLAKTILPMFPEHTCYVEPFAGAGGLLFAKEPSKAEVLNDINTELVNFYRVLKHHLKEFCKQFEWALNSRKIYEWAQATPTEPLTDIQRAARFYYIQKLAFGGRLVGQVYGTSTTGPPHFNLVTFEQDLTQVWLRLSRVNIEGLDWQECIKRYDRPHTLFYCDPPYWGTDGYGTNFGLEQYDRLAEAARTVKGKMIISVNAIPEMRKAFKGLRRRSVDVNYTLGQVHGKTAKRKELIIRSW